MNTKKAIKLHRHKKSPEAPKKPLTPYILFGKSIRPEIINSTPKGAKATDIIKLIANKWSELPESEKVPFAIEAAKDKERYEREKASYKGPKHVPAKVKGKNKLRKDEGAPKRATSAFLYFSKDQRSIVQKDHPEMKNKDIASELGRIWNSLSESDKLPYVEKSDTDKKRYEVEKNEFNIKKKEEMK